MQGQRKEVLQREGGRACLGGKMEERLGGHRVFTRESGNMVGPSSNRQDPTTGQPIVTQKNSRPRNGTLGTSQAPRRWQGRKVR